MTDANKNAVHDITNELDNLFYIYNSYEQICKLLTNRTKKDYRKFYLLTNKRLKNFNIKDKLNLYSESIYWNK